ncbi:hypothetical protein CHUAL_008109 [Chamberlinius hualienensis]
MLVESLTCTPTDSIVPSNVVGKWQKKFHFTLVMLIVFTGGMCYSVQAPIYPEEAASKGITPTQYGFVFGVFQLVVVFSAPLFGAYAKTIGPVFLFNIGTLASAYCTILFGVLEWSPPKATFLSLSIAIRAISALGDSAIWLAGYLLAAGLYPNSLATDLAAVETSFGIGVIVGPAIGGFLFDVGGFSLPFFVIGGILMVLGFFNIFLFRNIDLCDVHESGSRPKLSTVFSNPYIIINCYSIFAAAVNLGYLQAFLQPHLSPLDLSQSFVGLVFTGMGATYALSSVVGGIIADKFENFNAMHIVGMLFLITGFLLVGPAPFIPLSLTVGLAFTSVVITGVGIGLIFINTVMDMLTLIAGDGPKHVAIQSFVSGLYNCLYAFGGFVGPTAGGPLFDLIGFSQASLIVLGMEFISVS